MFVVGMRVYIVIFKPPSVSTGINYSLEPENYLRAPSAEKSISFIVKHSFNIRSPIRDPSLLKQLTPT